MSLNSKDFKKLKLQHMKVKTAKHKERVTHVDLMQPPELTAYIQQARDKGASAWLNAIPIEQQRLDLSKEEFRDALCLRYNIPLKGLPSKCACSEPFNISHALSCKKGGFVAKRHDNIKDLFTTNTVE